MVVTFAALILGYLFAVGISTPIRALAASTRAISRGEFHQRATVQGAAEISELAQTFNNMADDIESFIARLKQAAQENRDLFLGSIRMLAAAIDEKDPYTRGHSDRVAKYSMMHRASSWGFPPKSSIACASPPCCTTSARSASMTACSRSPAR